MDSHNGKGIDITVGFDGSAASRQALRWAVGCAGDSLSLVHVVVAFVAVADESEAAARFRIEAMLDEALAEFASLDRIDRFAHHGDPVEVLLRCSSSTDLLVMGRHGTSQLIHNSMGSVGDACARLADCPVVIVPTPR